MGYIVDNRKLIDVINLDIDLFEGKSIAEIAYMMSELNSESEEEFKNDGTNLRIEFRDISGGFINFSVSVDMTEDDIEQQKLMNAIRAKEDKKDDMKELKKILKKYNMEVKEWK